MSLYALARPVLGLLSPEAAHDFTLWGLERGFGPRAGAADDPVLATELFGRRFANPVGLAAGFDKDARVMAPMLALGFGFVEIGSVTPEPQPGNPRPRVFRLKADGAVINRYGFNSRGLAFASARLEAYREGGGDGLVGVNLGKNKTSADAAADYARGAGALAGFADYLVINVSSPNTPGLRALQDKAELEAIVAAVRAALPKEAPPLLLKIAPDLKTADRRDIAAVATAGTVDGLIVSNTTIARPDSLSSPHSGEAGGLSGRPLMAPSTALLADMFERTGGRVPIVGVGGIASGTDAYAKIRAGASLVQLYTALAYEGPELVSRIKIELASLLRRDGFDGPAAAVGADHR